MQFPTGPLILFADPQTMQRAALTALLEVRCWMSCLTDIASASAALGLVLPCCALAVGLALLGVGEEPLPLPRAEAGVLRLGSTLEASLPAGVATVLASCCVSWVAPMPFDCDMSPACSSDCDSYHDSLSA